MIFKLWCTSSILRIMTAIVHPWSDFINQQLYFLSSIFQNNGLILIWVSCNTPCLFTYSLLFSILSYCSLQQKIVILVSLTLWIQYSYWAWQVVYYIKITIRVTVINTSKSHNSLKFPENFHSSFRRDYTSLIQYGVPLWGVRIRGGGIIVS